MVRLSRRPEIRERAGIEDVVLGEPAAPRLTHTVEQVVEVLHAVGVAADRDQHAFVPGELTMDVEQIKAIGLRIELQKAASLPRMTDDSQHIHVIGLALIEEAPGRMRKDGEVRMIHGAEDPLRLFGPRKSELGMHRADHEVELGQYLVRQVQAPCL